MLTVNVLPCFGLLSTVMSPPWARAKPREIVKPRPVPPALCSDPVLPPHCVETTAMGAAYLAGLGVGYWESLEEIEKNWRCDRVFAPQISPQERQTRLTGWQKAVACAKAFE